MDLNYTNTKFIMNFLSIAVMRKRSHEIRKFGNTEKTI